MAALSAAQRDALTTEGYVVVDDVLDPARDVAPLLAEYAAVLDRVAESFHAEGIIRDAYRDLPFTDRLIRVCRESGRSLSQYFDFSLPQSGIHADTPIHLGPAVFAILTHPSLLALVASAIGPEIFANPVQHIRMKLPAGVMTSVASDGLNAKIPWHQDNGVVLPEADAATILTVWLPLNDATVENGCLQVIPRSHRGDLAPHCPGPRGAEIPARLLAEDRAVSLPMRAGSALLMHQRTIHSSLDNVTPDQLRISMDLRYQPIGQPTGRPAFPGFVARSAAHPERALTDPAAWARLWLDTRARLAARETATFNRWKAGEGVCA